MFFYLLIPVVLTAACGFLLTPQAGHRARFGPFLSICTTVLFLMLAGICNLLFAGTIVWYAACAAGPGRLFCKRAACRGKALRTLSSFPRVFSVFLCGGWRYAPFISGTGLSIRSGTSMAFGGLIIRIFLKAIPFTIHTVSFCPPPLTRRPLHCFIIFFRFCPRFLRGAYLLCRWAYSHCMCRVPSGHYNVAAQAGCQCVRFLMVPLFFCPFPLTQTPISQYIPMCCAGLCSAHA